MPQGKHSGSWVLAAGWLVVVVSREQCLAWLPLAHCRVARTYHRVSKSLGYPVAGPLATLWQSAWLPCGRLPAYPVAGLLPTLWETACLPVAECLVTLWRTACLPCGRALAYPAADCLLTLWQTACLLTLW